MDEILHRLWLVQTCFFVDRGHKGAALDVLEHRHFRIFPEIFVKKLDGVADHRPEPHLEDLKGNKKKGTTTYCGVCVIA